jgi:hypothetical protein
MARLRDTGEKYAVRVAICGRMRGVRLMLFGRGVGEIARMLGCNKRSWANYERSTAAPPSVVLTFILKFGVRPEWLLTGRGPVFGPGGPPDQSTKKQTTSTTDSPRANQKSDGRPDAIHAPSSTPTQR